MKDLQDTFPLSEAIPAMVGTRGYNVLGHLSQEEGNMWSCVYQSYPLKVKQYWAYATRYYNLGSSAPQAHYNLEMFLEELGNKDVPEHPPPKHFDPRCLYFDFFVKLSAGSPFLQTPKRCLASARQEKNRVPLSRSNVQA